MQSLHFRLELPLGSSNGLVLDGGIGELLVDIRELLLGSAAVAVSLLQKSACLLQGILHGMGLALSGNKGIPGSLLGALLVLKLGLALADLLLVLLDGLLGGSPIGYA